KIRKETKTKLKAKRSRLIIRNLSFDASEENLRELFSPYGKIVDINLPKKIDGKLKGFAFLSFENVGSSLKAIKEVNGKNLNNRTLAVDLAVPKDVYIRSQKFECKFNEKNILDTNKNSDLSDEDNEIKDKDDSSDESEEKDRDHKKNDFNKHGLRRKSDVGEGKTIFIRNLDIETEEHSLANLFGEFGDLEYCKICYDELTTKSRGTAFVKFEKKEDAQKCLEASQNLDNAAKFSLDGKQLILSYALSSNQLSNLLEEKKFKNKDKRNLYLAKEGLIYPDSPAAVGVSQNDLKKRLMLEEKKRKLLRNLHYFISDRRLCIHNLPPSMNDRNLKKLILEKINDKNAKILWIKVMRNRSKIDKKFGPSKGFAFVEFSEHIHALKTLRILNNNPAVFTKEKRPIVEFSIENKVALNLKKYRQLKQLKHNSMDNVTRENFIPNKKTIKRKPIFVPKKNNNNKIESESQSDLDKSINESNYAGVIAKPFGRAKVVQPKLNRKILEKHKKLRQTSKRLKSSRKLNSFSVMNLDEKPRQVKKTKLIEDDDLELKFLKRKSTFVNDEQQKSKNLIKKKKWFQQ
ncbi:RNA-binding protein 28-like protein, partial [Sarcoptes scabiei]